MSKPLNLANFVIAETACGLPGLAELYSATAESLHDSRNCGTVHGPARSQCRRVPALAARFSHHTHNGAGKLPVNFSRSDVLPVRYRFEVSESQRLELQRLAAIGPKRIGNNLARRVAVACGAATAASLTELQRICRASAPTVRSDLRRLKREGGVAELINQARAKEGASKKRPPGKTPTARFDTFVSAKMAAAEAVIELAALDLHPNSLVAIFAIRAARPKQNPRRQHSGLHGSVAVKRLVEEVRRAVNDTQPVAWTRGRYDHHLQSFCTEVSGYCDALKCQRITEKPRQLAPFGRRYGKEWRFVAVARGDRGPANARRLTAPHRCAIIEEQNDDDDFAQALERTVRSLRFHFNIRGLFPTFTSGSRFSLVRELRTTLAPVSPTDINDALRRSVTAFYANAVCGWLLQVTPSVIEHLGNVEPFGVASIGPRPRVSVKEHDAEVVVGYQPLPNLEQRISIGAAEPADFRQLEKFVKQLLRDGARHDSFDYAVRRRDTRRRLELGAKSFELPMANRTKTLRLPIRTMYEPVGVVAVPRLMKRSKAPVDASLLADASAASEAEQDEIFEFSSSGAEFLVLVAPELILGIDEAFRANLYGYQLAALNVWNERLREGFSHDIQFGERAFHFNNDNPPLPLFYFSEEELSGAVRSREIDRRFAFAKLPTLTRGKKGTEIMSDRCRFVGYDGSSTLRQLYLTVDADFLLREISDAHWNKHVVKLSRWTERCLSLVQRDQPRWGTRNDEVADALSAFERKLRRVSRTLIENAQRLICAGHSPTAVVMLQKSELESEWRRFRPSHIRSRRIDKHRRETTQKNLAADYSSLRATKSAAKKRDTRHPRDT